MTVSERLEFSISLSGFIGNNEVWLQMGVVSGHLFKSLVFGPDRKCRSHKKVPLNPSDLPESITLLLDAIEQDMVLFDTDDMPRA
jgi:hypothetical protein